MTEKVLKKHLWLNSNFFEEAFRRNQVDETVFVKTFEVTSALVNRSQNYWCDVIKIKVNHTNSSNELNSDNVVIKVACYNPYMAESMEKYDPFKRELFFHQELLPKIEDLLLSVNDKTKLTENVIAIVNERPQPKYLLFKELSVETFRRVERQRGLNVDHLKVVLCNLAKLHAASAVLPVDDFKHHQEPNISEYFKIFHSLFVNCVQSLAEEISTEAYDEAELLAKKLKAFEGNMIDKSSEAFMLRADDFGVLCHGDLWLNNLLFEYNDEATPTDVRMVDFGLSYFGSPGIDLSYLLFTSSSDEIRDYEIDILLQFYHQQLHANLIKLNYLLPIPSLIEIHSYFLKCGVIGFMYSCLLLPMRFGNTSSLKDISALVELTDEALKIRREVFADPSLKERFQFLLNYCFRKGILD